MTMARSCGTYEPSYDQQGGAVRDRLDCATETAITSSGLHTETDCARGVDAGINGFSRLETSPVAWARAGASGAERRARVHRDLPVRPGEVRGRQGHGLSA